MKYILMMNARSPVSRDMPSGRRRIFRRTSAFMRTFSKELKDRAYWSRPRAWGCRARPSWFGREKTAEPITDGVFPESKEFLAGYWIIDVESPEQAYKIAARASASAGPWRRTRKYAHRSAARSEWPRRFGPLNIAAERNSRWQTIHTTLRSSICCVNLRRRCSAPSLAVSGISPRPRMRCRRP